MVGLYRAEYYGFLLHDMVLFLSPIYRVINFTIIFVLCLMVLLSIGAVIEDRRQNNAGHFPLSFSKPEMPAQPTTAFTSRTPATTQHVVWVRRDSSVESELHRPVSSQM
jgi:hypothetical protein